MLGFRGGLTGWCRAAVTKRRELLGRTPRLLVIETRAIHWNAKAVNGDSGRGIAMRCSAMVGGRGDNCYRDESG